MKKKGFVVGLVLILITLGLSGCVSESPISDISVPEGKVEFTINDVVITNTLEIKAYFGNETKNETSNDTKFVIISLIIENKENKWLVVQTTPAFTGLIDDEGNMYSSDGYVEINGSTYSIEQICSINKDEAFVFWSTDIKPNSTEIRQIVFTLPTERNPDTLTFSCGFRANKETTPTQWFHPEIEIPS